MTREDEERLMTAFSLPPLNRVGLWNFEYEYPGYFVYWHDDGRRRVYFTPDFEVDGVVDIQIERQEGGDREVHEHAYTAPLDPEALFAIVRPYLGVVPGGRKHWDPRMGATEVPTSKEDLEEALLSFREMDAELEDNVDGDEVYTFKVDIGGPVRVPEVILAFRHEDDIRDLMAGDFQLRWEAFQDKLRADFRWIVDVDLMAPYLEEWWERTDTDTQMWVGTWDGVFDEDGLLLVDHAPKRLNALLEIQERFRKLVEDWSGDLRSPRYWRELIPAYGKMPPSRKEWDPRKRPKVK